MTTYDQPARTGTRPMITGTQAALLVAAPLTAVVSRLLMTAQYQDDQDRPDSVRYLADLDAAPVRNGIGMTLMLVSAVLFVGSALVLTTIARRRMHRVGTAAGVLSVIGACGLAGSAAQVGIAGVLADAPDRASMVELWSRIYVAPMTNLFFLALLFGSVGAVLFAVALYRTPGIPRSAAVVTGVGTAAVFPSATGPAVSWVTTGAAICLVGQAWIAWSAQRVRS